MKIIAAIQSGTDKADFVRDEAEAAMWDRLARGITPPRPSTQPEQSDEL